MGRAQFEAIKPGAVLINISRGALVRQLPTPGAIAAGTTVYLVTDEGRKFPVPDSPNVLGALGYPGVTPVPVAAALLDLIPSGPDLDPQAARGIGESPTPVPVRPPAPTTSPPKPSAPPTTAPAKPSMSAAASVH